MKLMTRTLSHKCHYSLLLGALIIGAASIAHAGAPGHADDRNFDRSVMLISPAASFDPAPQLSPAEIRNAVSVRMDSAAEQGFSVDRASVDGIGLEATEERLVEAR